MVKLLICLFSGVFLAAVMLQLRQERLNLSYQANRLHSQIQSRQADLWNQQMEIARATAPNAIARTVGGHQLELVSPMPVPGRDRHWMEATARGQ